MQTRAILEGAAAVIKAGGKAYLEIIIPLVGHVNELRTVRAGLERAAQAVEAEQGISIPVWTRIEVPRGALTADETAGEAEFFSFGTNDLTQMTFGFSRDDSDQFRVQAEKRNLPSLAHGTRFKEPFDIFAQQVAFDIDAVAHISAAQCCDCSRMRNCPNGKSIAEQ